MIDRLELKSALRDMENDLEWWSNADGETGREREMLRRAKEALAAARLEVETERRRRLRT